MPTQPIALADIVRYLAGVARLPAAAGQSFDVGGPDVLSYKQMIERVARLRGRRPLILEVPILSPRLSSYWLHLVTPVHATVARPLVEGVRNPTIVRDDRIRRLVPFHPTPFDEAARAALSPASREQSTAEESPGARRLPSGPMRSRWLPPRPVSSRASACASRRPGCWR